jgi:membrane peptidoglycan carboxypeptidase
MSDNKKKFKRTAIISIILVSIIVLSITIGLAVFAASDDYVQLDIGKIKHPIVSATVLDKNGEIITTQNAYVKLSELKPYTINSFLAVEDSRFYQHNGVDYRRLNYHSAANKKYSFKRSKDF